MPVLTHLPLTKCFYLCRHGQSEFNARGILQGHMESPLTALGKQQARVLASKTKQWNIQHIVSSHLGRAKQTAEICAQQLSIAHHSLPGFAERQLGCWQGQALQELQEFTQFQQHCYQHTSQPAGNAHGYGETTDTVRQRMVAALHELATQSLAENILIISHGDALACLMSLFTTPVLLNNTQGMKLIYRSKNLHWAGLID
ncbi:MAG: histidine phosphatase family protein [Paraglaciecola polaris]|uniref:histidine phosphatase family protein n=1 Tax=Paraglaciecola polaris TaxID=222814 RepID=UPI003003647E